MMADLGEEVRPFDVDRIGRVEIMFSRAREVLHGKDAGIGDEDVDFAELVDGVFDHSVNVSYIAGIGFDGERVLAAAELLD